MRPNNTGLAAVAAALLLSSGLTWAADRPDQLVAALAQARQDSITAAHDVQQRQAAILALTREIDLLERDLAARRRGLEESHTEQAQLLGALERLTRGPRATPQALAEAPIDRVRREMLLAATVPALHAEAKALSREIGALPVLQARILAQESDLAGNRDALSREQETLAETLVRRAELIRRLRPESDKAARPAASPQTADLDRLIAAADAAADQRNKALLAHRRASRAPVNAEAFLPAGDPTRPKDLRSFAAAAGAVLLPAAGTILTQEPAAGAEAAGPGLHLATPPGAVIVAPSDGQVVYAGPFEPYLLVLIIRHTDGYHSLLAGLGRADSVVGQWVLGGEPVGVTPGAGGAGSGGEIYFELRRDGGPVDPQPWLAPREESADRGGKNGD